MTEIEMLALIEAYIEHAEDTVTHEEASESVLALIEALAKRNARIVWEAE